MRRGDAKAMNFPGLKEIAGFTPAGHPNSATEPRAKESGPGLRPGRMLEIYA
jgi:hypothetical protein